MSLFVCICRIYHVVFAGALLCLALFPTPPPVEQSGRLRTIRNGFSTYPSQTLDGAETKLRPAACQVTARPG